jgi:branched-chain amino acid transport system ATP-binding protein
VSAQAAVLEVRDVCKRFGGLVVADRITLTLRAGEVLGLIGPNGAGKTTLFHLIAGLLRPDSGRIRLAGRDVTRLPAHRRARLGLARTWQNVGLFPELSVLENLLLGARRFPGEYPWQSLLSPRATRREGREAEARARSLLMRIGLEGRAQDRVGDLPFGIQKLVGVLRALMNEGSVLLLDEPMAGVQEDVHRQIRALVREAAAGGRGVILVEHNVGFVRDLCDRALFLSGGAIVAAGTVEELTRDPRLTDIYFGS